MNAQLKASASSRALALGSLVGTVVLSEANL